MSKFLWRVKRNNCDSMMKTLSNLSKLNNCSNKLQFKSKKTDKKNLRFGLKDIYIVYEKILHIWNMWVIYMTYSIKQVRYCGVKDGNTWRNQAHPHTDRFAWWDSRHSSWFGNILVDCRTDMCWTNTHSSTDYLHHFASLSSSYFTFQGRLTLL
jgi:hypothetical protein